MDILFPTILMGTWWDGTGTPTETGLGLAMRQLITGKIIDLDFILQKAAKSMSWLFQNRIIPSFGQREMTDRKWATAPGIPMARKTLSVRKVWLKTTLPLGQ